MNLNGLTAILAGVAGVASSAIEFIHGEVTEGISTAAATAAQTGVVDLSAVGSSPAVSSAFSVLNSLEQFVASLQATPVTQAPTAAAVVAQAATSSGQAPVPNA